MLRQAAILSYHPRSATAWDFSVVRTFTHSIRIESLFIRESHSSHIPKFHSFFEEVLPKEETRRFFAVVLPRIIKLAMRIPELVPLPIDLLKSQVSFVEVSLSERVRVSK